MTPSDVEGASALAGWRSRWDVTIASDVSGRDGIGWEFLPRGGTRGGCLDIHSWEGEEWALEQDAAGRPTRWAAETDERVAYAWLRARTNHGDRAIAVYQDDGLFGLNFQPTSIPDLPLHDVGILRPRQDIPLTRGPVNQIEVVYDTTADGASTSGVLTEVLLHADAGSTLLIAAEAYSADEWRLFDESVVSLPSLAAAERLTWIPARKPWRSTKGHPL